MKKIIRFSAFFVVLAVLITSCHNSSNTRDTSNITLPTFDNQKATVKEAIQTASYTYLRVLKNNEEQWIAIDRNDNIKKGDVIYYEGGLRMDNFKSSELGRTFETVYFVQNISDRPIAKENPAAVTGSQPQKPVLTKMDINIEQPEDGISIGNLYANRDQYEGKIVKVRGKVTKINKAIMGRNWVHLQDGTSDGDSFDLTVTTNDEPAVGDIVTYTGTLNLERDFGAGYSYAIILEEAVPVIAH